MDYNATLTIHTNKPATENDDIDDVMEAFAAYHPAVGDAPACPGALTAVITLPAHTLTQAVATATALAAQVGDLVGIEVIPTRMWDRREGLKIDDVEFVGVSEAAVRLGRSWALTMSHHELRAPWLCRWAASSARRFSPRSGRAEPGCRCYRRVADGDREGGWRAWWRTFRGEP